MSNTTTEIPAGLPPLPTPPEGVEDIWSVAFGLDKYLVSTHGRVMSIKTGRLKTLSVNRNGYLCVSVMNNKRELHRIVAQTFLGISSLTVDHIDNNRTNASLLNLRYISKRDNIRKNTNCIRKDNKSGVRGVHFNKRLKQWISAWCDDGQRNQICFRSFEEAKSHAIKLREEWT